MAPPGRPSSTPMPGPGGRRLALLAAAVALLVAWRADPSHSAELAFAVEPSDHIAVQERPLVLPCQVEGIQPISITWRKNGAMTADSQGTFTLANGSLYFSNFQKLRGDGFSDEGEYECTARNRFGLVVSRKARIQAATLPGKSRNDYRC